MSAAKKKGADATSSKRGGREGPRVALVGARRARQGLGPYVARSLAAHGASVPAFVGTSAASVEAAAAGLREGFGIEAQGYLDASSLLAAHELDALAILSPAETHAEWLAVALEAGLHVLVEKPLLWGGEDDVARAASLGAAFAERGLLVVENCQWPYTLDAFDSLHPGARAERPTRFAMELSPASLGVQMIGDALPHALALLQALVPATEESLVDVRFSTTRLDADELDVAFEWHADGHVVSCLVSLRLGPEQPRRASYAVDGHWAHRLIRTADYAQFFGEGARLVDVPDPLDLLVGDFARTLAQPDVGHDPDGMSRMVRRCRAVHELAAAYQETSA